MNPTSLFYRASLATLAGLSFNLSAVEYKGYGESSVSPETLAKYAPTPLPNSLSRRIQALFDLRPPGMGMVSPRGKQLFFTWRVTGSTQIWRLDRPDGFPIQMTGGEDRTLLTDISPDGTKIFVTRDQGGDEASGIYWQHAAGGQLHEIFRKDKVRAFIDFVSRDSRHVYFHANDIKEDSYAIYRYDLETGATKCIFSQDGLWEIADHRDETTFLLAKRVGSLLTEYSLWHPGDTAPVPVLGQGEHEEYTVTFSSRPGEYLVLTPKFGEFRRLYRFNAGRFTAVTPEIKWDVSSFSLDEPRKHIYYQTNENGFSRAHIMDAKTYHPLPLPSLPNADHVVSGRATPDGRLVSLAIASTRAPSVSFVYDWQRKKLTQWTKPSVPEIDLAEFPPVSLENYTAHDGTLIPMFVRRPKACENNKTPCPVIVSFHGGPESQALPVFNPAIQIFIEKGYIFVEPNVRGSDGYGKSWLNSDNGPHRLDVITDIRDCADYIRSHWSVAGIAPKIGVFGGSYGGYSAQIAMTMFAGSYDAGVSVVGMSNLLTFLKNTAPYRRILRETEYGDPEKDRDALIKLSPVTYVDKVKAPILFLQGLNDPRVPAGEAIQMHESLLKHKIPSKLVIFPDEGHGAAKRSNQVLQYGYALEFFETHLQ